MSPIFFKRNCDFLQIWFTYPHLLRCLSNITPKLFALTDGSISIPLILMSTIFFKRNCYFLRIWFTCSHMLRCLSNITPKFFALTEGSISIPLILIYGTVLQTQDWKFKPWWSEAEHATSRSRRLQTILSFTSGLGRNIFVSFKPPRPGNEPRALEWKGPRPPTGQPLNELIQTD